MELKPLLLLTLLGVLLVGPGLGQRGDADISEWLKAKEELIQNLEDQLKKVETWQSNADTLEARLNATEDELARQKTEVDRLSQENKDMRTRLNATEEEIDKLKESSAKAFPIVAFSASLANSGQIYKGPCTDKTLVFQRVFANTGAYDPLTGHFTAPLNGLYYFIFSTYGYNTHVMGGMLMKNGERQISTYDSPSADGSDSSSNAVILLLAEGDKVHMELWDDGRVFDSLNGQTTFTGFLLSPL